MLRRFRRVVGPCGALLAFASGCASVAKFQQAECAWLPNRDEPQTLSFRATIEARNLEGQQLLYYVNLLDGNSQALKPAKGKFQDSAGKLAASKALLALDPYWVFENETIGIPVDEIGVRPDRVPTSAVFSICTIDGALLSQSVIRVPPSTAMTAALAEMRSDQERRRQERQASADTGEPARARSAARRPQRTVRGATEEPAAPTGAVAPPEAMVRQDAPPRTADEPGATPPRASTIRAQRPRRSRPLPERPPEAGLEPAAESGRRDPDSKFTEVAATDRGRLPQAGEETAEQTQPNRAASTESSPSERSEAAVESAGSDSGGEGARTPPTSQPEPQGEIRQYVVKSGDTLSHISRTLLGDANRWPEIFQLNRDVLDSPDSIWVGLELRIPPR